VSHIHPVWRVIADIVLDELSTLSVNNFVRLIASYNSLMSGSENRTSPELESRGYSADAIAHAKKAFLKSFVPVTSCGLKFSRPFEHLEFKSLSYVLMLNENYERGCLPFPGSVSEQPAQIMEIFSILRQLKFEVETKLQKASRASTPKRGNRR